MSRPVTQRKMYTHRPYRDRTDIARMKRLSGRGFALDPNDMPFGSLEWVVFGPQRFPPRDSVELWEDGRGEVIGWALLDPADSFEYRVAPGLNDAALDEEIAGWGMRGILSWRKTNGLDARCAIECWGGDQSRIEILTRHGFRPSARGSVLFSQCLDRDIAQPDPPEGWTIRGLRDADVNSRATTQYEAFSPGSKTTPETWRYLMDSAPGYDPDLDNVAVGADGEVGAAALVWLNHEHKVGEFQPVGTRPVHQRKGLGRAVLLRGLAKMRQRGMETAIVGTNATNAPAIALYQSVGFEVCIQSVEYVLGGAAKGL